MPNALTITGTRSTGHRPLADYAEIFAEYLGPFARPGTHFYIGGATGIDSLSLLWLTANTSVDLTVVVPATLADQPADARRAVATAREVGRLREVVELGGETKTLGYYARNRWMVNRSQMTIGFPLATNPSGGTIYTLDYTGQQQKPRLIVPI